MTTKVYFKVTWIFKDGRNSVTSDFTVEIYEDVLQSLPNTDDEDNQHIYEKFHSAWFEDFPHFKIEEYRITTLSQSGVLSMRPYPVLCSQLKELFDINKKTCVRAEGAIPLIVEQRRRTQQPSVTNALAATREKVCRECRGSFTGISFECVQCYYYIICCLCVTSGKHPQHTFIRVTDSKVDRDTVAKLKSAPVKVVELQTKILKIKEKDAQIQSFVSQAVALLSQPCDRVSESGNYEDGSLSGPDSDSSDGLIYLN